MSEFGTNLQARSQGLPFNSEMLRREIGNGLRGAHPKSVEDEPLDDSMEGELIVRSYVDQQTDFKNSELLIRADLQPEAVVASLESHIENLLRELSEKYESEHSLSPEDISYDDVHVAAEVCTQREEMVKAIKIHDPLYVAGIEGLAEREVKRLNPDKGSELITKIDAIDTLIIELESEIDDSVDSEDPHFLEVVIAVRNKFVAELNAEQMAYYYALAA